jgi:hypothetical protein
VREAAALALAICSLLLVLAAFGPVPRDTLTNPLAPKELWSSAVLVLGGTMLAIAFGRRLPRFRTGEGAVAVVRPVRGAFGLVCGMVERADGVLRQWPIAGVSLLLLAMLFGAAMMTGR